VDLIIEPARRRTSRLGTIGEELAAEALAASGFTDIRDLNKDVHNQPFADLLAEEAGVRYFISVKARNENRDDGRLNESYNCFRVADPKIKALQAGGNSTEDVTRLAHEQIQLLARGFDAIPAWTTIPIRPEDGTYAVYSGLLSHLGNVRSVPMTPVARAKYRCLVNWVAHPRIKPDLTNRA
jgi:hypothetical protein